MYPSLQDHSFIALKILCTPLIDPSLPSIPSNFCTVFIVLLFPEYDTIIGVIQYVGFSD